MQVWIEAPWIQSPVTPIRVENDFFHRKGFYVTFKGATFAVQADELEGDFKQSSEELFHSSFQKVIAMRLMPGYRLRDGGHVPLGFDVAACLLFETIDRHYVMISNKVVVQFTTPEPILKFMYRNDTIGLVCRFEGATNVYLPTMYMYFSKQAWDKQPSLPKLMKNDLSSIKPLDHKMIASYTRSGDSGIMTDVHPLTNILKEFHADKKDTRISTYGKRKVRGTKTYFTNDHGIRRFKVVAKGKRVDVFKSNHPNIRDPPEDSFNVPVWSTKFVIIWIPNVPRKYSGNSILIRLCLDSKCSKKSETMVYIGESIYSFDANEVGISYRSPIDELGVSRPVAVGLETVFVLSEMTSVPLAKFRRPNDEIDWYEVYQSNKQHASSLKNLVIIEPNAKT